MITWILIVILTGGTGVATTSLVFHSKESCEKAAKSLHDDKSWTHVESFCFEDKR